jgi:hypothetical protein
MCLIITINFNYLCIIMNETMSVVLATAILAIGGLGLYMYKQSDGLGLDFGDDDKSYDDKSYDDRDDDDKSYDDNFDYEDQDNDTYSEDLNNYEPRITSRGKTKRAKTAKGTKKRKY